jgi:hypothetical protein
MCVVLTLWWARSYRTMDAISGSWRSNYIYVGTVAGELCVTTTRSIESTPATWLAFSEPVDENSEASITGGDDFDFQHFLGCRWAVFGDGYQLIVPLWTALLSCGALAIAPWLVELARRGHAASAGSRSITKVATGAA